MTLRGVPLGFGFWNQTAGFDINQTLIPYSAASTYGQAFWVGLLNTLMVAGMSILLATPLGLLIGIARLSPNALLSRLTCCYIELMRNIPLLLQLYFWYNMILQTLPPPRQSLSLGHVVFLNNRGLFLPKLSLPSLTWDYAQWHGFNLRGGIQLSPECVALVFGLVTYSAGFIAEIVRAGLRAVPLGQREAAAALGLHRWQALHLVLIPQAFRLILPPLTSQWLNIVKNSSLAVFIGYPDLVLVFAGTVLNQTQAAVQVMSITMGVYLLISLVISFMLNMYNARIGASTS